MFWPFVFLGVLVSAILWCNFNKNKGLVIMISPHSFFPIQFLPYSPRLPCPLIDPRLRSSLPFVDSRLGFPLPPLNLENQWDVSRERDASEERVREMKWKRQEWEKERERERNRKMN